MWIAQQRDDHIYVGGIMSGSVRPLIGYLKQHGIPAPDVVPETRNVMDASGDTAGAQGMKFYGVTAERLQPLLDAYRD
jgi:hypothetical protein